MTSKVRMLFALAIVALVLPGCSSSPVVEFGSDTRFAVIGDFGTGGDNQKRVAQQMCRRHDADPFRFVITTGDNVYGSGEPEDFQRHFKQPYECLSREGTRFRAVLGNHDAQTDEGRPEVNDPAFGMPARFYSWRSGPVTFIMLDSNTIEDGEAQLTWLRERLKSFRSSPWTVVVMHHPVHSSGSVHGSTPGFDTLLGNPLSELGADLVLAGHDHNFQRGVDGDVTYYVSGGGGAALYGCEVPLAPPIEDCEEELHFLEVTASERSLTVTAIDDRGETIDEFQPARNE